MSLAKITQMLIDSRGRKPERTIYQLLDTVGDGTGAVDMNHTAARDYYIRPKQNEKYVLRRLNLWEVDADFSNASVYGATGGAALTNGIKITVENNSGVIKDYTPVSIKTTFEWALLAGVDSSTLGSAGADPHLVRWTFARGGGDITLDGSKGEFLKVSMGDAMNFLTQCRMQVQGYIK